jgi:hypothetical protein
LNCTEAENVSVYIGPIDADHDFAANIDPHPFETPRTVVFVGGDTGPHPEAAVGVDATGQPVAPDAHVSIPDWFKL